MQLRSGEPVRLKQEGFEQRLQRLTISRHCVGSWLLLFVLFCIYTEISLDLINDRVLPAFPFIFLIPVLVVWLKKAIKRDDLVLLLDVGIILLASVLFSRGLSYWLAKTVGVIQMMVSMIGGILLFRLTISLRVRLVDRILLIMWVVLLLGAVLEVLGPLRDVSDSFRAWVYNVGGYRVYDNDLRDIALTGNLRPKCFASEPSLLGIGFAVFINGWLLLRPTNKRFWIVIPSSVMAAVVIGSPVVLVSILMSIVSYINSAWHYRQRWIKKLLYVSGGILLLVSTILFQGDALAKRFGAERFGESAGVNTSENIRLFLPYQAAITVLGSSPLFGAGISGKEAAHEIVDFPFIVEPVHLFGNNVAALFMYLGIVGGLSLTYVLRRYMYATGIRRFGLFLFFAFSLGQTMGGFESPRFWGYLFLIMGLLYHADVQLLRR